MPAFESDDGKFLFESNAIAFYLANEQLRGKTVADQASVMQWTYWASNEIYHQACIWLNDSDRAVSFIININFFFSFLFILFLL